MKTALKAILILSIVVGCSKKDGTYIHSSGSVDLNNRPVGATANEILSSSRFTSITIEVQYMSGYPPDVAALSHIRATLNSWVKKPGGIIITTREIPASSDSVLAIQDVVGIEDKNRNTFTTGTNIAVYLLYTSTNHVNDKVLGMAYKNTSLVLYGKKIQANSGGIGQVSRTSLVATVAEHELAHLLGLVDNGTSMQTGHKDAAHGNHCNNRNCLMYYAAETTDILGSLIGGNIPSLDANCLADIHANGGQ